MWLSNRKITIFLMLFGCFWWVTPNVKAQGAYQDSFSKEVTCVKGIVSSIDGNIIKIWNDKFAIDASQVRVFALRPGCEEKTLPFAMIKVGALISLSFDRSNRQEIAPGLYQVSFIRLCTNLPPVDEPCIEEATEESAK